MDGRKATAARERESGKKACDEWPECSHCETADDLGKVDDLGKR